MQYACYKKINWQKENMRKRLALKNINAFQKFFVTYNPYLFNNKTHNRIIMQYIQLNQHVMHLEL